MAIIRHERNLTLLVCGKCHKTLWRFKESHKEEIILIMAGFKAQHYNCKKTTKEYSYCEKCGTEYDDDITPTAYIQDIGKVCMKCINEDLKK